MPLLFLLLTPAWADEPFEPPNANRPDNFRGAVGLFRIQASANPLRVAAGEPIYLTIRISADDSVPVLAPPTRPEIEKDPEFTKLFRIEAPEPAEKKSDKVWEFYYLLKP